MNCAAACSQRHLNSGVARDALAFVVPLLLAAELNVGGRLFVSEVILAALVPILVFESRTRLASRLSWTGLALASIWLVALVSTDLYRHSSFADYSRGWARVGFLLLDYVALALLIDARWRRVSLFALGLACGMLIQYFVHPNPLAEYLPWKFGYGFPITLGVVLIASSPRVYGHVKIALGLVFLAGLVNFLMDFRSLGGICVLTAAVAGFAEHSRRGMITRRHNVHSYFLITAVVAVGIAVVATYSVAASHNLLGAQAKLRYDQQKGIFGIPVGRPETIASLRAIRDSPVVGHGSWPKDPKYLAYLVRFLRGHGMTPPNDLLQLQTIPMHSYLFGTWVEAGLAGILFWIWCFLITLSVIPQLHLLRGREIILSSFIAMMFLWDILFSPFSAQQRLLVAFYLIVILLARSEVRTTNLGTSYIAS